MAFANGVVYFLSSRSGDLYALNAKTGKTLTKLHLGTGISGPSVSHGRVFVGTGDAAGFVSDPSSFSGSLFALGLRHCKKKFPKGPKRTKCTKRHCKKKFPKGPKRTKCIKKAKKRGASS